MPKVSIIVPIYNTQPFLQQCLESIAAQTLNDIEVLCIDDGSTDGCGRIIDEFAAKDERFCAIHKQNAGYGAAVNTGLDAASAPYIGIVEPDDYIDAHMYEKLLAAASANAAPDVVKASYWRVINAGSTEQEIVPSFYYNHIKCVGVPFTLSDDADLLIYHPSIWTAIYKREFLRRHHIRMHEIPGAGWADNPWLIETLAQAQSIVYIDECLYYYRESIAGSSSKVRDPSIIFNRWLDMDAFIHEQNIPSPAILEAHYSRGCAYIQMLQNDFPGNQQAEQGITQMLPHMDKTVIERSSKILMEYKEAYFSALGGIDWFNFRAKRKLGLIRP